MIPTSILISDLEEFKVLFFKSESRELQSVISNSWHQEMKGIVGDEML
jgi:hypothetical protein